MKSHELISLSRLFDISTPKSFDTADLNAGNNCDYITRTTTNNGVKQVCGTISGMEPNSSNTISLELMNMTFFYRPRQWYAGQFMRLLKPKFEMNELNGLYIKAALGPVTRKMKGLAVRKVDDTFLHSSIYLPITNDGELDFATMESYILNMQSVYLGRLSDYLTKRTG
jgi:hypothetical protein